MQRPSSHRGDHQFQQQQEAEAAAIHKLVGAATIHHSHLSQDTQEQTSLEEEGQYTPSHPVSPLISPSVKARPSSAAGNSNHNIGVSNTTISNNHSINNKGSERPEEDLDSRSQSPISFLDSPRPLIQAQDQGIGSGEATNSSSNNTVSQPISTVYRTIPTTQTNAITSPASQAATSALRRDLLTPSTSPSSALTSTSTPFDQQRGVLKSPLSTTTILTNHNEIARSTTPVNSPVTVPERHSSTYRNTPQQPPHPSPFARGGGNNKSPTSPSDKKKKNWFGLSWGNKDSSSSNNTSSQQQQLQQGKPPIPPQQQSQSIQQSSQAQSQSKKLKTSSTKVPSTNPPVLSDRRVLQKKKRPVAVEKKPQLYNNPPHPINNSPEPSIASRFTNEEQDLDDDYSEVTKATTESFSTVGRQSQLNLSEQPTTQSSARPSLEHFEPDSERSFKTASSQSQQAEIGGIQKASPAWETRLRQGQPHHQRAASTDETITIQSAGASAQTNRAELKYRDERFVSTSRPPSRQSIEPPSPTEASISQLAHTRSDSNQNTSQSKGYMGGSSNQQHPTGRNGEPQNNPGTREGQYGSTLSVNNQQQPGSYRNTPQASPMVQDNSTAGQGRSTSPPPGANASKSREDLGNIDMQQLASKHDELNEKYRKVKKYYFDKDAQVQQLQNQLAHQRLSQSRTNLDDNEYAGRFARLDGAINNLAFNIRKDWRAVPSWLSHCVNKEATNMVTKEMTAVGRACISRWLVDEVFDRYFHPGLEPHLSCQLKVIEKNIRRFLPPPTTDDEREALVAKMSNWRLSTLDGLKNVLDSEECRQYREELTKMLVTMLTEDLRDNLKEPPPSGLDAGVIGIIELAVGIAANIPYESRDIFVDYLMPGVPVNDAIMKIEAALPALNNPGEGPLEHERSSMDSGDDRSDDGEFGKDGNPKKKGMLGGLMGGSRGKNKESAPKEERVRFAAFMLVEVRGGKSVLVRAPVYV